MHMIDLPAGVPVRLTATARPDIGIHRWDLRVISRADVSQMLAFGSQIGGLDRDQRIAIPAQRMACRVEITARHASAAGWGADRSSVIEDTPSRFEIGFSHPSSTSAGEDDLSLSLVFGPGNAPT